MDPRHSGGKEQVPATLNPLVAAAHMPARQAAARVDGNCKAKIQSSINPWQVFVEAPPSADAHPISKPKLTYQVKQRFETVQTHQGIERLALGLNIVQGLNYQQEGSQHQSQLQQQQVQVWGRSDADILASLSLGHQLSRSTATRPEHSTQRPTSSDKPVCTAKTFVEPWPLTSEAAVSTFKTPASGQAHSTCSKQSSDLARLSPIGQQALEAGKRTADSPVNPDLLYDFDTQDASHLGPGASTSPQHSHHPVTTTNPFAPTILSSCTGKVQRSNKGPVVSKFLEYVADLPEQPQRLHQSSVSGMLPAKHTLATTAPHLAATSHLHIRPNTVSCTLLASMEAGKLLQKQSRLMPVHSIQANCMSPNHSPMLPLPQGGADFSETSSRLTGVSTSQDPCMITSRTASPDVFHAALCSTGGSALTNPSVSALANTHVFPVETLQHTTEANSTGLRQAILTPAGGCILPPLPTSRDKWRCTGSLSAAPRQPSFSLETAASASDQGKGTLVKLTGSKVDLSACSFTLGQQQQVHQQQIPVKINLKDQTVHRFMPKSQFEAGSKDQSAPQERSATLLRPPGLPKKPTLAKDNAHAVASSHLTAFIGQPIQEAMGAAGSIAATVDCPGTASNEETPAAARRGGPNCGVQQMSCEQSTAGLRVLGSAYTTAAAQKPVRPGGASHARVSSLDSAAGAMAAAKVSFSQRQHGGKRGSGNSIAAAPVAKRSKQAASLASLGLSEELELPALAGLTVAQPSSCITVLQADAKHSVALKQFQTDLATCCTAVVAVLLEFSAGPIKQYASSLQQLTKTQQDKLKKAKRHIAKTSGSETAANNNVADGSGDLDTSAVEVCAGLAIMCLKQPDAAACSCDSTVDLSSPDAVMAPMYFLPLKNGIPCGGCQEQSAVSASAIQALLHDFDGPVICCNCKVVLRELARCSIHLPSPGRLRLVDTCVLAWLVEAHLVHDRLLDGFSMEALAARFGLAPILGLNDSNGKSLLAPLQRLRLGLLQSARLADAMTRRLSPWLPPKVVQVEMQIAAILAEMEAVGVACDAALLQGHKELVCSRSEVLSQRAAAIIGHAVNMNSPAQLATVLYQELRLPVPAVIGRGSRTHHPTDEAALQQLAHLHPLPGIILEYRCWQNVLTKWLEPAWVHQLVASAAEAGQTWARLSCQWNQTATATGRLSSSAPNLQAVTKYTIQASSSDGPGDMAAEQDINIRDAFVAPEGRILVSADYSQIELRILAHLSQDARLISLLRRAGTQGDAFHLIAAHWLQAGDESGAISRADREKAKRVTYGIVYGLTPFGLAQALADQAVDVAAAARLRASFLSYFNGVQAFISRSNQSALQQGFVTTLLGRRRYISGLDSGDARVRAEAERKVVNSIVQGSAADLIKIAMCHWSDWLSASACRTMHSNNAGMNHAQRSSNAAVGMWDGATDAAVPDVRAGLGASAVITPSAQADVVRVQSTAASSVTSKGLSPSKATEAAAFQSHPRAILVGQIHDELLFECDAHATNTAHVVEAVKYIMENVSKLDVPLIVNVSTGQRWGSMQPYLPVSALSQYAKLK